MSAVEPQPAGAHLPIWNDPSAAVEDRVAALIAAMTVEEKLAQLYGVWVGAAHDGGEVAPHQNDMVEIVDMDALLPHGLGQLTRPFGTAPVDPALGALSLMRTQERIVASGRFGIPAVAHEECLAGFAAWGATAYPVPLAWGATFNTDLVTEMARRIGADMRSVGIHQGLAPVLDVVRDARWGRVEETIGEDPTLVATIGTAYVAGLEDAGIIATLKHFVGYSASRAGRNLAPVSVGPRELADVLLPPFEMALRDGHPRSVMNAYTDIDGVPTAGDASLLTDLLRTEWGFDGTVVADYYAIGFLHMLHGTADSWAEAAGQALEAGIDVELPTVKTFGAPLREAIADGRVDEALVDRALDRVLRQKVQLGLLDPDWTAVPSALADRSDRGSAALRGGLDLDSMANREVARRIAEQSVVLLSNDGTLPLAAPRRIAVIGPNADNAFAVLGCYSFPAHIGVQFTDTPIGIDLPTLVESVRAEFPDALVDLTLGTTIDGGETDGFAAATAAALAADVVVLALGDRAGLFGRGTSGEGCDVESLVLPGAQQQLLDAVLATGTPTIVTLLSGRPYALGNAVTDAAAIVQTFFPGEEGTPAIAGILSGRVHPSGRLPVSVPAHPGAQPSTYLASPLASASSVSNVDPSAAFAFGHGLGYTELAWTDATVDRAAMATGDSATISVVVGNTSASAATEVVQLYLSDPVASVVRPVRRLVGFARVEVPAGSSRTVTFSASADLAAFTGRAGARIVEPGDVVFSLARSSAKVVSEHRVTLTGPVRVVDYHRQLVADVAIS